MRKYKSVLGILVLLAMVLGGCQAAPEKPKALATEPEVKSFSIKSFTLSPFEKMDGGWTVIKAGTVTLRVETTGAEKVTFYRAPTGTDVVPEVMAVKDVPENGSVELQWEAPNDDLLLHLWVMAENSMGKINSDLIMVYHEREKK